MATAVVGNQTIGEAQALFAEQSAAKKSELMERCDPYSVINFNPVPLHLSGEFNRSFYRIPSAYDDRLPPSVQRIRLPYDGKERIGHILTMREPHMYGKMTGASQVGSPGEVVPQREPQWFEPIAIAYSFLEHFSPLFVLPRNGILPSTPKDARKIHGVLAFRGDIHTIERILDADDPAERMIDVPVCTVTTVGKTSHKSFRAVSTSLDAYLEKMFEGQKRFADGAISRAQQKWAETETIRDISDSDRVWYRWAIGLGYAPKPKPGEKTWLNELLSLTGGDDGPKADSRLRKCQACRTLEPEPDTPFCPKCAAPINTFTTFMAGYPVADAWLMALKGEEREIALEEMRLRRSGFEVGGAPANVAVATVGGEAAEKTGKRGPYKKSGKGKDEKEIIDDIPAAASTAIPGEE
jgi:hypothetical protein